ncbi:hypothetical protein [Alkalinema sp. FACHB-956]|uniref:hypothetical protein n=1 Tax=Alkalinema sp. FACHB-956 TaxID=2692768 RepID=UPI001681FA53|nr:hypothetical protein [Alkalinema sp. FACHB-956]MBD2328003.1 hypothetical protein [Alkalinema sp. FACHB-956]
MVTRHSKQNYYCWDYGRQFVLDPAWKAITSQQYGLIEQMLLDLVSLAGIACILQISEDTDNVRSTSKLPLCPNQ